MAKIQETFNFGDTENLEIEDLLLLLGRMYTDLAQAVNRKPDLYERDTEGLTTDTFLSNGDLNINTTSSNVQMLVKHTSSTAVVWKDL